MNLKRSGYKARLDFDDEAQVWSGFIKGRPDMEIYAESKEEAEEIFYDLVEQLESGYYD